MKNETEEAVLARLRASGVVCAGKSEEQGRVVRVSASMLLRLEREGHGTICPTPDGGIALRSAAMICSK